MTPELKLKCAKELPHDILILEAGERSLHPTTNLMTICDYVRFFWHDTRLEVTDREWDWILDRCIDKSGVIGISVPTVQQRAEAYFKTKGE